MTVGSLAAISLVASTAAANSATRTPGPKVSYESVQPSDTEPANADQEKTEISHKRWNFDLMAPIPLKPIGLTVVANWLAFRDHVKEEGKTLKVKTRGVYSSMGMRAILIPTTKPFGIQFLGLAGQYRGLNYKPDTEPMTEYVVGAVAKDWGSKFLNLSDAIIVSRLIIRWRNFPGRQEIIGVGDLEYHADTGWYALLRWPANLIFGSRIGEKWEAYGGHNLDDRIYTYHTYDQSGWLVGYTSSVFGALRYKLWNVVYAGLRAGYQKERTNTYDRVGKKIREIESDYAPFVRIGIETLIEPSP